MSGKPGTESRKKKPHRERKNPAARDRQARQRREQNAARGAQVYDHATEIYGRVARSR